MSNLVTIEKVRQKKKFSLPLMPTILAIGFLVGKLLTINEEILEKYYSSTVNKWIIQNLSKITGIVPFSLAEGIFIAHIIILPVIVAMLIYKAFKGNFLSFFYKFLGYLCGLYIVFMLIWGFNYSRMALEVMLDFETQPYSKEQLYQLNEALIMKANVLREGIHEDSDGVMYLDGGYRGVFLRSHKGYEVIGGTIKALSGSYGKPKPLALSDKMLYTGIAGIYFPYTAEANVNVSTPHLLLPATTLHEMAHQRGFASEDEANYIAYLTASAHPDIDFKYSGTVLALIHSMNALSEQDRELAVTLRESFSEGLIRDMKHNSEFWKSYKGKVNETANKVNDAYLKSNGQEDGTKSYGKMVDLLLAHFIKYNEI